MTPSEINPASVLRMVPVRPIQMRLFPEPRKKSLPLEALALLGTACAQCAEVRHAGASDITERSIGTAVIITGARLAAY